MTHFPFSDLNWRWRRRAKPSRKGRDGAAAEGSDEPHLDVKGESFVLRFAANPSSATCGRG